MQFKYLLLSLFVLLTSSILFRTFCFQHFSMRQLGYSKLHRHTVGDNELTASAVSIQWRAKNMYNLERSSYGSIQLRSLLLQHAARPQTRWSELRHDVNAAARFPRLVYSRVSFASAHSKKTWCWHTRTQLCMAMHTHHFSRLHRLDNPRPFRSAYYSSRTHPANNIPVSATPLYYFHCCRLALPLAERFSPTLVDSKGLQ